MSIETMQFLALILENNGAVTKQILIDLKSEIEGGIKCGELDASMEVSRLRSINELIKLTF